MKIEEMIKGCKTICISGHVKPDGDCIGSCLALYDYIVSNYSDVMADVRLMPFLDKYRVLRNADQILTDSSEEKEYDLFIVLDSGDAERLGENRKYFESAKKTVCIDHHISNLKYADVNVVDGDASSTCELLFRLLDEKKVTKACAEALYTGLVNDTGVFKHSCTTSETLELAGRLMRYGIDAPQLIQKTFTDKTYAQTQIMGKALLQSMMFLDGKCVASLIKKDEMDLFGVTPNDMDGIIDQLISITGVQCAVFAYEVGNLQFKVSLRSKKSVDVSKIALLFGGGGHVRAAGCTLNGTGYDVMNNVIAQVAWQLEEKTC